MLVLDTKPDKLMFGAGKNLPHAMLSTRSSADEGSSGDSNDLGNKEESYGFPRQMSFKNLTQPSANKVTRMPISMSKTHKTNFASCTFIFFIE